MARKPAILDKSNFNIFFASHNALGVKEEPTHGDLESGFAGFDIECKKR
jgi:hypothetical protein